VDDTIIFMDHDLEKAKILSVLLCKFENLSGLKIKFHKSKMFCFGEAKEAQAQYLTIFGCQRGGIPF
jgi:hypothetical protein